MRDDRSPSKVDTDRMHECTDHGHRRVPAPPARSSDGTLDGTVPSRRGALALCDPKATQTKRPPRRAGVGTLPFRSLCTASRSPPGPPRRWIAAPGAVVRCLRHVQGVARSRLRVWSGAAGSASPPWRTCSTDLRSGAQHPRPPREAERPAGHAAHRKGTPGTLPGRKYHLTVQGDPVRHAAAHPGPHDRRRERHRHRRRPAHRLPTETFHPHEVTMADGIGRRGHFHRPPSDGYECDDHHRTIDVITVDRDALARIRGRPAPGPEGSPRTGRETARSRLDRPGPPVPRRSGRRGTGGTGPLARKPFPPFRVRRAGPRANKRCTPRSADHPS